MNSVLSSTPVTFTAPMPGLENVHDFALRNIDSAPGLFALESGSAPVRLFLADAAVFVPGYTPPLPAAALEALEVGGRLAVISFHSLEDRMVKQAFKDRTIWKNLTPKPIVATQAEQRVNPRCRTAKLRVAMKT